MTASEVLVFDLKRFAVHDGFGIRTTVFLKGCPLRCRWCQNPEGLKAERETVWFSSSCIHCGLCHKACPDSIQWHERPVFDAAADLSSAVSICPSRALRYDSTYYDIDTLVEKIREDQVFFDQGGGVTFSGGEPFLQFPALLSLLKKCHEAGIHTAIETSLFTSGDHVKAVLPYLDEIYCDMKLYDEKRHEAATGVSNRQIKENIAYLLHSDQKEQVTVRTPLIPGFTADDDNLSAIASFLVSQYDNVRYELLNYNPLALAKYSLTSFTYGVRKDARRYTREEMDHFHSVIKDRGIRNVSE